MEKQKIKVNSKVVVKEKTFEVKSDMIVPDIKPDMVAIKNTNANTYIYKQEISRGKVRLDGCANGYVLYLAENGEARSLEVTLDFIESIEDDKIVESQRCKSKVSLESIEAKILNERKLCVTASVKAEVEIYESNEIEFISKIEDEKIEVKAENYQIQKIIGEASSKASTKEFLEIKEEQVSEITRVEIELQNKENKTSFNKILSKADVNIAVTYQTEESIERTVTGNFPITSFIDMENVKEEYICESSYSLRNMLFKVDSVVANKISFEVDYEINLSVYENTEISFVQDIYSLNKDIEVSSKDVEICANGEMRKINIIQDYNLKENLPKNEYSMVVYFVKPHDTIWNIAKMFKVTMQSIIDTNNLENPDKINIGDKLYIVK